MPIYDSSFLTKRMGNKTIARDFINRINRQNITSYGPLQGNYDNSIMNSVAEGRQQNITKCQIGYQTDNGGGCPCPLSINITPGSVLPTPLGSIGLSNWINQLFRYVDDSDFDGTAAINDITTDLSNNIYVIGYYQTPPGMTTNVYVQNVYGLSQISSSYTLPFTSTALSPRTFGFIIKYNTNGEVQKATYFGTDISSSIASISIDTSGDIYITGNYNSTAIVTLKDASGNGQVNSPSITLPVAPAVPTLTYNIFTIKYSSSLVAQWATSFTSTATSVAYTIEVGPDSGVYITGYYSSSSNIIIQPPSPIFIQSTTSSSSYLIKYNTSGIIQWATIVKGNNSVYGHDISFYGNYVYLSGPYNGTPKPYDVSGSSQIASVSLTLPTSTAPPTEPDLYAYLIQYNSSGAALNGQLIL